MGRDEEESKRKHKTNTWHKGMSCITEQFSPLMIKFNTSTASKGEGINRFISPKQSIKGALTGAAEVTV